ncbi:exonuclease [bacterium]|nr:exonuclease [bacterium]
MEIIQGSQEWHDLRLGKITASKIADILAVGRSGESISRKNYKLDLIRERITGKRTEGYINGHMERGIELEPLARATYEVLKNVTVNQVAFVEHPTINMAGASPDGLIDHDGLLEIKCPKPENHVDHLLNNGANLIAKYNPQVQWQLACTKRQWCDLVSFDPDMHPELQLFVTRIYRDNKWIAMAEKAVVEFDNEINESITKLKEIV